MSKHFIKYFKTEESVEISSVWFQEYFRDLVDQDLLPLIKFFGYEDNTNKAIYKVIDIVENRQMFLETMGPEVWCKIHRDNFPIWASWAQWYNEECMSDRYWYQSTMEAMCI